MKTPDLITKEEITRVRLYLQRKNCAPIVLRPSTTDGNLLYGVIVSIDDLFTPPDRVQLISIRFYRREMEILIDPKLFPARP